ncbi:NAD(+) diphosphatase [Tepidicaulis sp. LMO-SS28]|uniref:NAD(+) diphosphatase n=1 Tax=Tepidicaulis sp. LMO-SS28 TaxID=3447455 RepID=UPI003EE365CC
MPLSPNPNIFANSPINRAGHLRGNPDWLAEKRNDPSSLFVPLWNLDPLVLPEPAPSDGKDVGWVPLAAVEPLAAPGAIEVFLGINKRGKALFAIDISAAKNPETEGPLKGFGAFEEIRGLAMKGEITPTELAILAQAKGMIDWHKRHGFCSNCGAKTELAEAGYKRACNACNAEHFPRTDPVVIMIATYGDKAFLGRQKIFPKGMYSALAGFMEPGESIEEAVARELDEEAKIAVKSVRYHSTQPWPFPSSLMIGCIAEAESEDFEIDGVELSSGKWFTRDELAAAVEARAPGFFIPPPFAIAHHLVKAFVAGE